MVKKRQDMVWGVLLTLFIIMLCVARFLLYAVGSTYLQLRLLNYLLLFYILLACLVLIILAVLVIRFFQIFKHLFLAKYKQAFTDSTLLILPLVILLFNHMMPVSDNFTFLGGLKKSFQKEIIDVEKIQAWLDTIEITQPTDFVKDESGELPPEIRSLTPNSIGGNKTESGKNYVVLQYGNIFMRFGITIGASAAEVPDNDKGRLNYQTNAFVWMRW